MKTVLSAILCIYLQCVDLHGWNNSEAEPQIWLFCIDFNGWCQQIYCMPCNRFFIMYTMVMRREQSAQQPWTMFRGIVGSLNLRNTLIRSQVKVEERGQAELYHTCTKSCWMHEDFKGNVTRGTYSWPINLLAIVVQHPSTIQNKKPSFPVTSQVWWSLWEVTLTNGLNLKISTS